LLHERRQGFEGFGVVWFVIRVKGEFDVFLGRGSRVRRLTGKVGNSPVVPDNSLLARINRSRARLLVGGPVDFVLEVSQRGIRAELRTSIDVERTVSGIQIFC
jgi:hypothetical protein